jgi:DNA-binding NarL/FixJ family response regulator
MSHPAEPTISVILADDHQIFRDGFRVLLKKIKTFKPILVAEAENGKELVELTEKFKPDFVFTDIQMPLMDGVEATRIIKERLPKTFVIALSMFNQENLVLDMLQAGANGYLLKNTSKSETEDAIRIIQGGGVYFCPETSIHLTHTIKESKLFQNRQIGTKFSDREIQILWHICKGFTNKEIAARLNLSSRTIESHREHILEKTGTKNSVEVAVYALKHGIVDLAQV